MIVPEAAFQVTSEVRFFAKPTDSGNMVQRGFCPHCGSALYATNSAVAGLVLVRAPSLDDPEVFKPQMVVYIDRAASWDHMDASLPTFLAMPALSEMPQAS